jgi:hypothetical protein
MLFFVSVVANLFNAIASPDLSGAWLIIRIGVTGAFSAALVALLVFSALDLLRARGQGSRQGSTDGERQE